MGQAIPLIAMALTAAGTGASIAASKSEQAAAEQRTRNELARQKKYGEEANKTFVAGLGASGADVAQKDIGEGTARREEAYSDVAKMPLSLSAPNPGFQTSNSLRTTDVGKSNAMATQSRANYLGLDDWMIKQGIRNLRARQNMAMIGQNAQGSAAILPYELNDALQSEQALHNAGSGLSTAGQLAAIYGMSRPKKVEAPTYYVDKTATNVDWESLFPGQKPVRQ